MKRILVTGGAGFIGSALCKHLSEQGAVKLVVLDNESLGSRESVASLPINFVRGDIRDTKTVEAAMKGCTAVVHLAADTRVMDSISNPIHNFECNALGTITVLEAARKLGVERLINASTGGAVLGDVTPPVHEDMVARPISPYGASKLASEGYCSAYAGAYGLGTLSLRFSNIYGPGSLHKGSVVAHFFRRLLQNETLIVHGSGEQQRDFLYIEDLAAGIASALLSDVTGVLQLGSGRPTSVNELIALMTEVVAPTGHAVTVHHEAERRGEVQRTWCRIERARTTIGFDPATSLRDGLARTWAWFVEHTG